MEVFLGRAIVRTVNHVFFGTLPMSPSGPSIYSFAQTLPDQALGLRCQTNTGPYSASQPIIFIRYDFLIIIMLGCGVDGQNPGMS